MRSTTYTCAYCGAEFSFKWYSQEHKYCNNQCQGKHRQALWMEANRKGFEEGTLNSRKAVKRYVIERDGEQCKICNQQALHNNLKLVMVLDHIDGDASNNSPNNFRLLCPNCDSQQPTFKGANRGKGRASRGLDRFSRL